MRRFAVLLSVILAIFPPKPSETFTSFFQKPRVFKFDGCN
jgi:hypothetical protein